MFAITPRLTLRPGWPEDAPELACAIGHEAVVTKLARAPWPYALGDAQSFLDRPQSPHEPGFLVFERTADEPRLVGGVGIDLAAEDGPELGYWYRPDAWGRGYATEAGRAVVAIARDALKLKRLQSGHFLDNPASGRVLTKLGFRPTGRVAQRHCRARGHDVPCALFELDLDDSRTGPMPLAA
ncbi:GNAT family N-acetyltransferase [Sphingomonas lenta]|uniref:GNAT family N-acetyltransferase n=1 Tax=Sphingomonas lenta TaxID=1141887 RepID=UPI0015961439|nr:GNAT family N-acetyltransferase [Sphingomonas lenta]